MDLPNKDTVLLNDTLDKMDLIDIYRTNSRKWKSYQASSQITIALNYKPTSREKFKNIQIHGD